MQKILLQISVLLLGLMLPAMGLDIKPLPKEMSVSQALYINCLQRTQTQQLLKTYLMIGLHSNYRDPQKMLAEAIPAYDKRFRELDSFFRARIKDSEHIGYLDKAAALWHKSKILLGATPAPENGEQLYRNFKTLVKLLGKAKVLAKKSFKAVGMTGGLCRDPLYISNLYLLHLWGAAVPDYDQKMQKIFSHFSTNIKKLKAYEGSTDEINMRIANAEDAFRFFTFMYAHKITIPTLISKKADNIFLEIRTIKSLYGKMLK